MKGSSLALLLTVAVAAVLAARRVEPLQVLMTFCDCQGFPAADVAVETYIATTFDGGLIIPPLAFTSPDAQYRDAHAGDFRHVNGRVVRVDVTRFGERSLTIDFGADVLSAGFDFYLNCESDPNLAVLVRFFDAQGSHLASQYAQASAGAVPRYPEGSFHGTLADDASFRSVSLTFDPVGMCRIDRSEAAIDNLRYTLASYTKIIGSEDVYAGLSSTETLSDIIDPVVVQNSRPKFVFDLEDEAQLQIKLELDALYVPVETYFH